MGTLPTILSSSFALGTGEDESRTQHTEDHEGAQQCLTKRSLNVGQKARASLMDVTLIDRKSAV